MRMDVKFICDVSGLYSIRYRDDIILGLIGDARKGYQFWNFRRLPNFKIYKGLQEYLLSRLNPLTVPRFKRVRDARAKLVSVLEEYETLNPL